MKIHGIAGLILALLAFAAPPVSALTVPEITPEAGLLWIGNYDARISGLAPNPLLGLVGISVPFSFPELPKALLFAVSFDLFGSYYEYDTTYLRALPSVSEAGVGFFTLGMILSPRFGVRFPPGSRVEVGAALGLDFLLRFPLEFFNSDPASVAGRQPALAYFFQKGRFFYPETELFLRWKPADAVTFNFGARALWPLFHSWDNEGLLFADQLLLAGTVGASFKLK